MVFHIFFLRLIGLNTICNIWLEFNSIFYQTKAFFNIQHSIWSDPIIICLSFEIDLSIHSLFILCSPVQIRDLILNPQVHLINQVLLISLIGALYEEKVSQEPSLLIIEALSFHLKKSLELELWLWCQPSISFWMPGEMVDWGWRNCKRMIPSPLQFNTEKNVCPSKYNKNSPKSNHKFWLIKHQGFFLFWSQKFETFLMASHSEPYIKINIVSPIHSIHEIDVWELGDNQIALINIMIMRQSDICPLNCID